MLARMWRKRNTPLRLVGLQAGTTTLVISLVVPQKTGHNTTGGPSLPLLGIYPRDFPTYNKDTSSIMFIAALFLVARSYKEPDVPQQSNGYRLWDIYTTEYYSAIKNNKFMKLLGKGMELENILIKVSQSQKNTHGMHSLISEY